MSYDDWKCTDPSDAEYCVHGAWHGCSTCGYENDATVERRKWREMLDRIRAARAKKGASL